MWNADNRPRHNRDKLRYPSGLTDQEWSRVEGVMLSTGCAWRYVHRDLPPSGTLYGLSPALGV
jgi:hypothetical protein